IVSVLAFIGGSFFPIGNLSNFFRILGNYTPNGAAMTAFLELLKGNEGLDIWQHVFVLIGFAVLFLGISIGLYPNRGQLLLEVFYMPYLSGCTGISGHLLL